MSPPETIAGNASAASSAARGSRTELEPVAPITALLERPERYGFFQAVRLLYRNHGLPNRRGGVEHDPVKFGAAVSLAFPAGELADLKKVPASTGNGSPPMADPTSSIVEPLMATRYSMIVNFMGLTGPLGALPRHYSEWLIARQQARDHAGREFLDIFNHRLIQLFWLAWSKHRPDVTLEFRHDQGLLRYVYDLVGMGTPALSKKLSLPQSKTATDTSHGTSAGLASTPRTAPSSTPLPSSALAYYSGIIAQRPHSAGALARVIGDIVSAPVRAQSCLGTWQCMPAGERTRLGTANARLADGCVLGQHYWDRQTTLQLVVGPLDLQHFKSLLPTGPMLAGVVEVCRFMTGMALDLRLKLELRADAVTPIRLGGKPSDAARLGWNTWLSGRRGGNPADECSFHFSAMGGQSWR